MVHTRNRSNCSVQPDGCGQRRGKTKSRSDKSSSRKTHLEDARVAPHSPRIESKCQVQEDEITDISISHINEHLEIPKEQVFYIINNSNQFARHLAKSDSERQKLKNQIIANLEQIHKNYEPHIPRHSTALTEEKPSIKGSLTHFLGENPICAKDIFKLEEWPTLSGEGEYNHIELIRTIDMLQGNFNIPYEIIVANYTPCLPKLQRNGITR
ncbi:hypothetical protein O181_038143 [Austropuccinia psidii MF-1]|uniref:Uncharacterized protein n=1 Tax=Austropuccinia psidii MF-1 TaxID=1389203 RepID=A0A9Q3HAR8_9BASI|nr:hypothetical protein [Austropuccinia psidii MF-1]